jgi:uncharacterized membrane protein YphA (DoxX/SURF4 family)
MRLNQVNLIAFTAVGVRLLALVIFFYIFREVSRMISLATNFDTYNEWPIYLIFIVAFLLLGMWLWKGALNIAKNIVPKEVSIEVETSSDFDRPIYQLAFVLLGMYVLISGVSDFSYTAQIYFSLPEEYMTPDQAKKHQAAMVSTVIEVLIGLALIIGAKGVSAVIYKIRYGGQ